MVNAQSAVSSTLMALRLIARLALVVAYSCRRRSGISRDSASATGSAVSMRGTIRRWWRLARTEAAVSPVSASAFNAFKAEASRT
jgi:hypothetical protein